MSRVPVYVFAKDPGTRPVKTRLAACLGAARARAVYLLCLEATVAAAASRPWALDPVLYVEGDGEGLARRLGWSGRTLAQPAGGLGERMLAAFAHAGGPALVVGSDAPELTGELLEDAARRLGPGRVVLGPAVDGGFWLLGAAGPEPALFRDMTYSHPEVLAQTLARARGEGRSIELLAILEDLDTEADLRRLDARLDGRGPLGIKLREALAGPA